MPRAMWKGVVTFGPVRVPVKLYPAVHEHDIAFHLVHDQDQQRLSQVVVCSVEDTPVPPEEQVKGLEVEENRYVVVKPEELEELAPQGGREIEVLHFVPPGEVDPRFYQRAYYLGPDGQEEAYHALVKALERSGRLGIAQWTMRRRSYLGALRPVKGVLAVLTLFYPDEVLSAQELEVARPKLSDKERRMARYLVEAMAEPFDPGRFQDEHHQRLEQLIADKLGGRPARPRPRGPRPAPSRSLVEALEASLGRARSKKGTTRRPVAARSSHGAPHKRKRAG